MRRATSLDSKNIPDLAIHNCTLYNPFTCDWDETSFAVKDGFVCTLERVDAKRVMELDGARVVPGLIDAHVHIESSMLAPTEFGRLVIRHGTTTVVADPHEIANVLGAKGLDYMFAEGRRAPIDIFYMLPSCVPASEADMGGAILSATDLKRFGRRIDVLGLGEVMDTSAVLRRDEGVLEKIGCFRLVEGHAPLMRGMELDAYVGAGIQSDHESTKQEEALEKLKRGMFVYVREGNIERNLKELLPLIKPCTVSRLCFATDDRSAEVIHREGGIDDCVRRAIALGCEPELALRMATLSPAERFGLHDRGAIAPGRVADFCILKDRSDFSISKVFRRGKEIGEIPQRTPRPICSRMEVDLPSLEDLAIRGRGRAHVVGLIAGQILTEHLLFEVDGDELPDTERDILKAVVCNRYGRHTTGIGLVHGLGLVRGAIAGSISHDAHNIVCAGADDRSIAAAIAAVVRAGGGLAVADGEKVEVLPLACAGLMSGERFEDFLPAYIRLMERVRGMDGERDAFMHLSFIALTVIPELRITDAGIFDALTRRTIPLFCEE